MKIMVTFESSFSSFLARSPTTIILLPGWVLQAIEKLFHELLHAICEWERVIYMQGQSQ
jgi:hypothetical protein